MFGIAGGHWAVLQSIAWARMVSDFSRNVPVSVAVQKTFSGEFPCAMCRKISDGRKSEQQLPATVSAAKKIEVFVARTFDSLPPPAGGDFSYPPCAGLSWPARSDSPASPVPRSVVS